MLELESEVKTRSPGLWTSSFLGACLAVTSALSQSMIGLLGGWGYVLLRFTLVAILCWQIANLPQRKVPAAFSTKPIGRFFDPLMGLRVFACLFVVMGHYFLTCMPFSNNGVAPLIQGLLRSSPWSGVWIFFTLSGYLMGKGFVSGRYSLDDSGSRVFWINRALRIVPIYIFGILLMSVLRHREIFRPRNIWMLLDALLLDTHFDLPIKPIEALWSVTTEFQFYLLVPVIAFALIWLSRKMGARFFAIPCSLLFIWTTVRLWLAIKHRSHMLVLGYSPTISNLDIFISGMSINFLPKILRLTRRSILGLLITLPVAFYFLVCFGVRSLPHFHIGLEEFYAFGPILSVLFTVPFICLSEAVGRISIKKNLAGLCLWSIQGIGTLTYCIYVFHSDIFIVNSEYLPGHLSIGRDLAYFPPAIAQVLAVAALFYFTIERPFEMKKTVA